MDKSLYYELKLQINPEMEDLISEIFFENFDCDGVVLAEETYKDLEMVSTTEGTLRVFLHSSNGGSLEDLQYDIENILDMARMEFISRGLSEDDLGSWEFTIEDTDVCIQLFVYLISNLRKVVYNHEVLKEEQEDIIKLYDSLF